MVIGALGASRPSSLPPSALYCARGLRVRASVCLLVRPSHIKPLISLLATSRAGRGAGAAGEGGGGGAAGRAADWAAFFGDMDKAGGTSRTGWVTFGRYNRNYTEHSHEDTQDTTRSTRARHTHTLPREVSPLAVRTKLILALVPDPTGAGLSGAVNKLLKPSLRHPHTPHPTS
jgi:hypothetical protein